VDQEETFTAEVKLAGINPYVDVPERVVAALGDGPKAAVLVKVASTDPMKVQAAATQKARKFEKDAARLKKIGRLAAGGWFRTTLVPLRAESTRLYLHTWMRETAGVDVGDFVAVTVKPDAVPRDIPIPARLLERLEANPGAKKTWEALAASRQREILSYLNFLKTPEALERNVQKIIASLVGQQGNNS
jgi:Bacteriocin-protection, YdeI or OmpD-Associated